MKSLRRSKAVNSARLYEDVIAALPELAPTPTGPGGLPEAQVVVEVLGGDVRVSVPDEVDDAALAAVIDRHVNTPLPPPPHPHKPHADAIRGGGSLAARVAALEAAVLTLLGDRGAP